jgi:hypothetical protein
MTLPTGKNKTKLVREGEEKRLAQESEQKRQETEKAAAEQRKKDDEFSKLVTSLKERIEATVYRAINAGHRETEIIIPKDYAEPRYLEAWTKAVVGLRRSYGKEYKFDLHEHRLYCDNRFEAANVDGVSYQEWTEDAHRLKVTW